MSASCCWLVDPTVTPEALLEAQAADRSHYMSKASLDDHLGRYIKTLCGFDTIHKFKDIDKRIILKFKREGANCKICGEKHAANPEDTV